VGTSRGIVHAPPHPHVELVALGQSESNLQGIEHR